MRSSLDKFKRSTSHCFHMQFLTTTFLFTIILVLREGSTSENRHSFSNTNLTECQEALSERQFGKQMCDTYFVCSWRLRMKRWHWQGRRKGGGGVRTILRARRWEGAPEGEMWFLPRGTLEPCISAQPRPFYASRAGLRSGQFSCYSSEAGRASGLF